MGVEQAKALDENSNSSSSDSPQAGLRLSFRSLASSAAWDGLMAETPSPASTHSLSYRPSSASSGQGIFSFRPSLSGGDSGQAGVLTPNNSGQRESRTTLEGLPCFQLPALQVIECNQWRMTWTSSVVTTRTQFSRVVSL
ncbi:zinc finger (RING finger) domain-containing protein, partial [Eschrichtius robustus]|nr:zinc finger (RING finger) domain-containing protein [Eschrichtius robustus]